MILCHDHITCLAVVSLSLLLSPSKHQSLIPLRSPLDCLRLICRLVFTKVDHTYRMNICTRFCTNVVNGISAKQLTVFASESRGHNLRTTNYLIKNTSVLSCRSPHSRNCSQDRVRSSTAVRGWQVQRFPTSRGQARSRRCSRLKQQTRARCLCSEIAPYLSVRPEYDWSWQGRGIVHDRRVIWREFDG